MLITKDTFEFPMTAILEWTATQEFYFFVRVAWKMDFARYI